MASGFAAWELPERAMRQRIAEYVTMLPLER